MVEELPPPTRAAILMALLGILLLGLFLVATILLGGNWVRKLGKYRRGPSVPPDTPPLHPHPGRAAAPPTAGKLPAEFPTEEIPCNHDTMVTDDTKGD